MAFNANCALLTVVLTASSLSACHSDPGNGGRTYSAQTGTTTDGAIVVQPLAQDTSQDIVSWVDGQVVTDWAAEIAKRDRAIEGYLDDADPVAREKYGFRSGQNPRLAWSWFREQPGRIQRRAVRAVQDDSRSRSESTRTRRCAPSRESGSARRPCRRDRARRPRGRSITSASDPIRPTTSTASRARPASASRRSRLDSRSRIRARSSRCRPPKRRPYDARLLARRVFQEHQPADRQAANGGQRGELGTRPAGFRQPGHHGSRVLFVRGLPRRPRDGVGKDEVPARHAQHGDRSAVLLEAADAHRCRAGRVWLRPRIHDSGQSRRHQARTRAPFAPCTRRCSTRRACTRRRCTDRRPQQIARGKIQALAVADEFPERDAGPDRRRRQDALHLSRRGEEQRVQAAAARRLRGSSRPDGCVRHRVGSRGDSHASSGQQLHGVRPPRQPGEPVLHRLLEGERPAGRHSRHDRCGDRSQGWPAIGSSRTFRRGRRRCRRRSTSRASTGRPSATTPTGTAIRALRRGRWPPAPRRPAIRAWSTCGSTSR